MEINRFSKITVALVAFVLFFSTANSAQAQGLVVPLKPGSWNLYGSYYQGPLHPKNAADGGVYFDFQQSTTGSYDGYFTTDEKPTLSLSGTLSMTFTIATTGSPVFNYMSEPFNTCSNPATVRPFFWGTGDATNDGRWWS